MRARDIVHLTITGRVPSKKNSRLLFARGKRIMNIPSNAYAAWHKQASEQIEEFREYMIDEIDCISLDFYAPDRRGTDLTNKAESIMDLLVDNGVIKDDNWWIVNRLILTFKGVDRTNPRVLIHIHRKTDGT